MKRLFLLWLLAIVYTADAQIFQIGHLQRTFIDSVRNNRSVPCEIYYPADQAGDNVPAATGIFPVIALGHGFVMNWSAYSIYWQNLVPKGFILVFPTTEGSFSPSHLSFGKDLAFVIRAIKKEGGLPDSPFSGKVDSLSAVAGHSMGGGAAFLAMQEDAGISAFFTMAAAETNPSAVNAASAINRPGLIFSAANDCVTPPAAHQLPMYAALNSNCKTFLSITGGNHCQFAGNNFNCTLGQATCSPQATINAAAQQNLLFSFLIPWLQFYLQDNCDAGTAFQNLLASTGGIDAQQNCSLLCSSTQTDDLENVAGFRIFPNPASKGFILVERSAGETDNQFILKDVNGRILRNGFLTGIETSIDIADFSEGFYFFESAGRHRIILKSGN